MVNLYKLMVNILCFTVELILNYYLFPLTIVLINKNNKSRTIPDIAVMLTGR